MNTELALLVLKKVNAPNAIKVGLVLSLILFKTFDIDGRIKRAMRSETVT